MHSNASHDAVFSSRSELKFEIDESKARAIRSYLGARLRPDPHSVAGGYPVCSVYMDSADDLLLRQTNQGVRNRYKLRVRIYSDNPGHPAYIEIKRREGSAVKKQRVGVSREVATALLSGKFASIGDAMPGDQGLMDSSDWTAFHEFCRLRDRIRAVFH